MRYWLTRLPFTFLLVGVWLAYEGYQTSHGRYGPVNPVRVAAFFAGAGISLALAMVALRERHRGQDDDRL